MARVAFLVIYSDSTERNVNSVNKKDRGINVPLMLMLTRWDGTIGFPGGKIDFGFPGGKIDYGEDGSDGSDGLAREVKEEINFECNKEKMKLISTFRFWENDVELFAYEVTKEEMKSIIKNSTDAAAFLTECQGCFAVQVANFVDNEDWDIGGLEEFKKHNFCASARVEIDMFIRYLFAERG